MSFTHAHVGDFAAALVDDQLDQATRDLVLLHLGRCAGCRDDVEEQRQLKARLRGLSEPGLPLGLLARLGALSCPADPPAAGRLAPQPQAPPLAVVTPIGSLEQSAGMRRSSMLRDPRRGRRMLAGAASLLLVGAGAAVATGGDSSSPAAPLSPASTFSTSFTTPLHGGGSSQRGTLPLTDPAFPAMTAAFSR
jgi:hypothetical protein